MAERKETYIGNSKLKGSPEKHLKVVLGEQVVKSKNIADKAVTSEKLADGIVTPGKIAKGGVEWENISEDVQNIIASMEKGGVALSGEFGDSELIGINQKKLTEVIGPEGTITQKVASLEETVGEGGSIDERIATAVSDAKTELVDGASEEGDTLKKLEDRLSDVEESVGEGGSVDERIAVETNRAQAAEELLREAYESLSQSQVIPKTAEEWAAMTSWEENVIYRVAGTTSYTDYMYNGTTTVPMATYNNAIDEEPTAGSSNLVKSGGVQNELALGAVYDVSAKNPTAGPNNDGKWESLSALLSDANLNTLIPTSVRKGGMSVKFIQSSDNKYVQYRLMADEFSTTESDWQGVDDEPIAGSDNLVKSNGIYQINNQLNNRITNENNRALIEEARIEGRLDTNRFGYNVTVFGLTIGVHTLATAVKNVPSTERFGGQKITFKTDSGWVTYQNISLDTSDYENVANWVLDSGVTELGDVTIINNPDYEDLTQNEGGQLKFADKEYNTVTYSGLGRKYLRKNIVGGVNTLTQAMMSDSNTIYVIQYDFTLGEDIIIPANCVLKFDGGSISASGSNDTITGTNTSIISNPVNIFRGDINFSGNWMLSEVPIEWFGGKNDGTVDCSPIVEKAINWLNLVRKGGNYTLKFLTGTYYFHTSISLDRQHIVGSGVTKTSFRFDFDDVLFTCFNSASISDLSIEKTSGTRYTGTGIKLGDMAENLPLSYGIFSNISVKYCNIGLSYDFGWNNQLENITTNQNNIGVYARSTEPYFHNLISEGNRQYGVQVAGSLSIVTGTIEGNRIGVYGHGKISITDCWFEDNSASVIDPESPVDSFGKDTIGGHILLDDGISPFLTLKSCIFSNGPRRLHTINVKNCGNFSVLGCTYCPTIVDDNTIIGTINYTISFIDNGYLNSGFVARKGEFSNEPYINIENWQDLVKTDSTHVYQSFEGKILGLRVTTLAYGKKNLLVAYRESSSSSQTPITILLEDSDVFHLFKKYGFTIRVGVQAKDKISAFYSVLINTTTVTLRNFIWNENNSDFIYTVKPGDLTNDMSKLTIKFDINMPTFISSQDDIDNEYFCIKYLKIYLGQYNFGDTSSISNKYLEDVDIINCNKLLFIPANDNAGSTYGGGSKPYIVFDSSTNKLIAKKNNQYILPDGTLSATDITTYGKYNRKPATVHLIEGYGYFARDTTHCKQIFFCGDTTNGDAGWVDAFGNHPEIPTSGTFANKPSVGTHKVPVGYQYFCTDRQTTEGATDGIEIIHKGNNVWVDALGRVVS